MRKEIEYYLQGVKATEADYKKCTLRYCEECSTVWEAYWLGRFFFKKYKDMPTYGLERERCSECKSEEFVYG